MNPTTSPPQSSPSPWRISALVGLVTAVFFFPLCWRLTHNELGSDFFTHLKFASQLSETGKPSPHPLMPYTLILLSPSADFDTIANTAAIVYAVCIGVSALFTARMLIHAAPQTGPLFLAWLAFGLTLAMALPNWWNRPLPPHEHDWWRLARIYLLQITPNCWHNPTTIFCMPFVLALYWLFIRELEQLTRTSTIWIGVMIAVTSFAKPNFILAFAPVYALHLAWYALRSPGSWQRRLATFFVLEIKAFWLLLPALWLQFELLRTFSPEQQDTILIQPLAVWQEYVPFKNIPFALLVGIFFPGMVFCCYPRQVLQYLPLQRAWLVFDVALLQFVLLMQKNNALHANFFWGTIFADRILFIQSTALVLQQPPSKKKTFCLFCLGLHFLSGFIYTGKCMFMSGNIVLF